MTGASEDIVAWTVSVGLDGLEAADLMAGYCGRLVDAGVPLWRASIGADTLHPLNVAQGHRWLAGEGVLEEFYARATTPEGEREWRQSPWFWLIENHEAQMRRRLAAGEGGNEFPLLAELAAQGGTDYWARIIGFGERARIGETRGLASSWATRDPGGFAARDLALIEATLPAFALAFKATMVIGTARTLVTTYLGRDAALRILRGEIDRGQVKTLRKVLWFSDLTGFTRIADTLPREQLLDLLNAYADCLVGVLHDHDGEVLKFMGDGILGVFGGPPDEACRARARRRRSGQGGDRAAQPGARRGRPAGDRLHACPARGRGPVGQRRQPGAARLHRGRAGGQRGQPDPGDEPLARPAGAGLGELRRRLRRPARAAGVARPLRPARRRPAAGAVYPRARGARRRRS